MTNEAAERLRREFQPDGERLSSVAANTMLDAALAEERSHVIEQAKSDFDPDGSYDGWDVRQRLDDLSTPEQSSESWVEDQVGEPGMYPTPEPTARGNAFTVHGRDHRSTPEQQPEWPIHECPPGSSGIMPCCGKTPFEAKGRMTLDASLVTCSGNYAWAASVRESTPEQKR